MCCRVEQKGPIINRQTFTCGKAILHYRHHSLTSKRRRREIFIGILWSCDRERHCTAEIDGVRITGHICWSDEDLCCEILQCIHRHLINKQIQVIPKEDIQGIDIWGTWRPSNTSAVSVPHLGICSIVVVTHCNRKKMCWCTIVHELHDLEYKWPVFPATNPRGRTVRKQVLCAIEVFEQKIRSQQNFRKSLSRCKCSTYISLSTRKWCGDSDNHMCIFFMHTWILYLD